MRCSDGSVINYAYVIKYIKGSNEMLTYCIISGVNIFIEEEVVRLIKIMLGVEINISGIERKSERIRVKREIIRRTMQ